MRADRLDLAIAAAQAFLSEAEPLAKAHVTAGKEREKARKSEDPQSWLWVVDPISGSPEAATVRRRSMDLTRSLAALRKP